jgi:hypothetical protein
MMMLSRMKSLDDLLASLRGERRLLLLGCNGCEESFGNAEPERLRRLGTDLEEKGRIVADVLVIDFLCEELLVRHWLPLAEGRAEFEAVLAVCCGIGVQVVSRESRRPVYPACDTVTLGGRVGQAWGSEACRECGHCILPLTGGICPLTACSKGLLNGPCGGSQDGRCEVFPQTRECGWQRIYERLEAAGRKDLLLQPPLIKDHSRSEPPEPLVALRNELLTKRNTTL